MINRRSRQLSGRRTKSSGSFVLRSTTRRDRSAARLIKRCLAIFVICALSFGALKAWLALKNYVTKSETFRIKSIEISGTKNISRQEILALLPFDTGDNTLAVNLSSAKKEILNLKPELRNIGIRRGFKKILISVFERCPVAFVAVQGNRLGIDYDNVIFPLRGEYVKADLPEISVQGDSERLEMLGFLKIFSQKAKNYFDKARLFYFESIEDAALKLKDGTKIMWGKIDKDKFDSKLKVLNETVSDASKRFHGVEYVDLNYIDSGRVLVRPKVFFKK